MLKKKAIASVRRAARVNTMNPQVDFPVHFFTNEPESNNNKCEGQERQACRPALLVPSRLLKVSRKKKRWSLRKPSKAFHKAMNFVMSLPNSPFLTLWIGRRLNGHPLRKSSIPLRIPQVSALYQIASKENKKAATARPGTSADRRKEHRRLHVQIPADVIEWCKYGCTPSELFWSWRC